jgi:hypothetical protein
MFVYRALCIVRLLRNTLYVTQFICALVGRIKDLITPRCMVHSFIKNATRELYGDPSNQISF